MKFLIFFMLHMNLTFAWKYQTKCTRHFASYSNVDNEYNSIIEDFERDILIESNKTPMTNKLLLKCPNINDFLFIGQTQYGVSVLKTNDDDCKTSQNDCVVTVDYIANQCNGLNSCDIQLDSQFLHTCKNNSDYITIAYECIPGSQKVDVCSNEETFIIDSSLSSKNSNKDSLSKFGSFYLTSPNYPNEYSNNLENCTCKLEYVKIDSNLNQNFDDKTEMNLVFKAYEFDLEEMEGDKCQKDTFKINSEKSTQSICGQYKNFKEFYSTGSKFSLDFQTDDIITRRGFLIKISTQSQSLCPYDSIKFSSNKCIKLFGDDNEKISYKLNWFEATKSCESLSGRLASVGDFVDDLRLSTYLNEGVNYWIKKHNETKCFSKRGSLWSEESCVEKNAFICEFDSVMKQKDKIVSGLSDNSGNRLIRVACGSSSTVFSSSFKSAETSTKKLIKSNSITNTQKPTTRTTKPTTSKILPIISESIINIQDYDDMTSTYKIALKKDAPLSDKMNNIFSQDLILIVAIACGVSIVLIAINVFCLWNYLSRKLKSHYENKNDLTIDQQTYRSSTISRSNKSSSNNRTIASSVDTYAKVPAYDLEHMSACESLSSSGSELGYNTNKPTHQQQQQHYYETLTKLNNQWNNYAEYNAINRMPQFESVVVMPTSTMNSHYMTAVRAMNPAVVLLKQMPQQQQQQIKLDDQEQYCVVYGELSPAPSNGSNQPLITFSSSSSGVSAI